MFSYKRLYVFFLVQYLALHITYSQPNVKFFRKDYTYIESTRAFYKIDTLDKTWDEANDRCEMEGANLFYPDDEDEAFTVIKFLNKTQPFSRIFIGISTPNVDGVFETVDGYGISKVYDKWGPGEPNNAGDGETCVIMGCDGTLNNDNCAKKYPFVCRKTLESLEWNSLCHLPDPGYEYNAKRGRCYKFNLNPMNWTEALKTCYAEDSYLAIIDDQDEADYFADLTARAPKDTVQGDYLRGAVHLGFYDEHGWKTIKNQTLEQTGGKWANGQPDGGDQENCGSMFYGGQLNDIGCFQRMFFICEHEIDVHSGSEVLKFGEQPKPVKCK